MHPFDMLLLLSTLAALVLPLLPQLGRYRRWLDLLPTVNVLLALAHYWREGLRPSIIPVYACVGLLWLLTLRRLSRRSVPSPQQHPCIRRVASIAGRSLGVGLLGLSVLIHAVVVTDLSGQTRTISSKRCSTAT